MAEAFAQGTDGRVKVGGVTVGFLEEWKADKKLQAYGADTFENTADGHDVVWKRKDMKSMAEGSVDLSGSFDVGNNSESILYLGASVELDLLLSKAVPFGMTGLTGTVEQITMGNKATATSPAPFTARVAIDGIAPAAA